MIEKHTQYRNKWKYICKFALGKADIEVNMQIHKRYGACLEDRKMSKNNIEAISDFCIFDKK